MLLLPLRNQDLKEVHMTSLAIRFLAISVAAGALFTAESQAQQVYRIVGSDGKVTFSDQPPPAATNAKITGAKGGAVSASAITSLPFELRQVATRYPVTLYTGDNCSPCGAARSLLTTRGIPFTEKTVSSENDSQALQRISGESVLPFATIGSQQLKGFSDSEWTQFLNAAGYPSASVLPSTYRQPAPTPLVATATAPSSSPATGANPANPRPPAPAVQPPASADNPAGIRF
jgi:glutaredoxin